MQITSKLKNVDELIAKLDDVKSIDKLKEKMGQASLLLEGQAKEYATFKSNNGYLRETIHANDVVVENDIVKGGVHVEADYGLFVEFGTGTVGNGTFPYATDFELVYSDKPYWRYKDKQGKWHTTKGMIAQPYLYRAYKDCEKHVKELIGNGLITKGKGKYK